MTSPEQMRRWRKANRDHINQYHRTYVKCHKEQDEASHKKWRNNNPDKVLACRSKYRPVRHDQKRLKRYGLTPQQYSDLLKQQNYQCAICGIVQDKLTRQLAVDHDHSTGKIRGLLCINCNLMLGCAKDTQDILLRGIKYLEHRTSVDQAQDTLNNLQVK